MIDKRLLEITDQAIDEFTNDDGAILGSEVVTWMTQPSPSSLSP
jgi:hypothetical protein